MKAIFIVAVLFIGCSNAKPAKRSSLTCSGFSEKLSGKLFMAEVDTSTGQSETIEISFNLDLNLRRMQEEEGDDILIMDFIEGKLYELSPGGCRSDQLQEIIMPEFFEGLSTMLVTSGSLGHKGGSVDCYMFQFQDSDGDVGVLTLESGNQCTPVSYALKTSESAMTGSFLDLKFTADPEKLKIPDECKQAATRRSMTHDKLKRAMTWAFPLFDAPRATRKRGFPWIVPNNGK